jgi:isoamylase
VAVARAGGPPFAVSEGERFPPGATVIPQGVNFSVFSRNATSVELLLYKGSRDLEPAQVIALDPEVNCTFFFWHVLVEGLAAGWYYSWRVDGPRELEHGFRFDPSRELLDPWARIVSDDLWDRRRSMAGEAVSMRARVAEADGYDWQGDAPLALPVEDLIIYELHVRGFTKHASSQVRAPGTFLGLIEKIPYLTALGVTAVELMPVFAFDTQDLPGDLIEAGLVNYWGYSPYAFFAPHPAYCATDDGRQEFRDMVKALHRAGIRVILDVVLNHTAEGGAGGPVINFKGLGNEFFYHLDPDDKSRYRDFSGCGNAINCNHPIVARFLLQCLEYWVREMHVDGFRFDLASVMARGEDGEPMYHAPLLWSIEFSEWLGSTKLIAEAWDAAGLYQVGDFPGFRWAEWNGRYRDCMRGALRGEARVDELATRLAGSSDLYSANGRRPTNSINFVTCHDGFTLHDLVSYNEKHNELNGENNRDGFAQNLSWNSGHEGPTEDPVVLALRERRARSAIALLMLSQGVPMLLAGDEVLRTQRGNNNAYCQDNDISWFDWSLVEQHQGMLQFTRDMISLRLRHPSLRRTRFLRDGADSQKTAEVRWYGEHGRAVDWRDADARVLCFTLSGMSDNEPPLHVMINFSLNDRCCTLPDVVSGRWRRVVDTSMPVLQDVPPIRARPPLDGQYELAGYAVAVFEAL